MQLPTFLCGNKVCESIGLGLCVAVELLLCILFDASGPTTRIGLAKSILCGLRDSNDR